MQPLPNNGYISGSTVLALSKYVSQFLALEESSETAFGFSEIWSAAAPGLGPFFGGGAEISYLFAI
jgi:hypothetical protein